MKLFARGQKGKESAGGRCARKSAFPPKWIPCIRHTPVPFPRHCLCKCCGPCHSDRPDDTQPAHASVIKTCRRHFKFQIKNSMQDSWVRGRESRRKIIINPGTNLESGESHGPTNICRHLLVSLRDEKSQREFDCPWKIPPGPTCDCRVGRGSNTPGSGTRYFAHLGVLRRRTYATPS